MKLKSLHRVFFVIFAALLLVPSAFPQGFDRIERDRMKEMLNNIKNAIKKNYYDPQYHGIDLEARFQKAEKRLDEVSSTAQAFSVIAQVLVDFNDSHLYFQPPATTVEVEYGFGLKMIGNDAFVAVVKRKSDADLKGLKPGDRILSIEGFKPTRKDLWKMLYYYYVLSPRTKLRLSIVQPGASTPVDIEVAAKVKTKKRILNLPQGQDFNDLIRQSDDAAAWVAHYFMPMGNTVVWKMRTFVVEPLQIETIMDTRVKGKDTVVLDLRGNGGGYVKILEQLAGYFFPEDKKIADRVGRPEKKKENEPMLLKSKKDHFSGKLIVLIDSQSGSASEIFARFVQLEKRGVVIGDVSAGAVMQSISYPFKMIAGINNEVYYGASITNADVIMSDGKSVEHTGVTPDEIVLPTAEDLRNGRDPALARALELAGVKISPESAWKMFEKANIWEDN